MQTEKKNKAKDLLLSLVLAITLIIFPVVSGIIISINSIEEPQTYWIQGALMIISIIVPLCILLILKLHPSEIGFSKVKKNSVKVILYFIPIIVAKIGYLFFGLKQDINVLIALLFFTVAVGLSEEVYFRGLILKRLLKNFSIKQAILISSTLFAAVHASQAFSGEGFIDVTLTIVNAFIFGVVAAEIAILTESLIPTIIWHTLYNLINWITLVDGTTELILIIIESIIMISYGIYLWTRLPKKEIDTLEV